jgi:membrane protein
MCQTSAAITLYGAVIGFLVWMWLSTIIMLVGAEINAEMQHQTARDTTSDGEKPM